MSLSFRARFAALVGWQILLLLALMASRWSVLAHGTTVLLGTVPVDPRELFRGEYVALRYTISSLEPGSLARENLAPLQTGETVYVLLAPPPGDARLPWEAIALLNHEPTEEEQVRYGSAVFIRGKVSERRQDTARVQYGIESYFLPEGEGLRLERAAGKGLTVEVKVDADGRAAIHRLLLNGKPIPRSTR